MPVGRTRDHRGFSDVTGVDYDESLRHALADTEDAGFTIETAQVEAYVDQILGVRRFERIVLFEIL